ncbi:MAG: hypothetical protein RIC35_05740 [Marinoscillum sp.]
MNLIEKLARSQGINNEEPNKQLAAEIVRSQNSEAVSELQEIIKDSPNLDTLSDVLKVIEAIGESKPELVSSTFGIIKPLLAHKSNKIQWRAMSALSTFASFHMKAIYNDLPEILTLMDQGSVITRDHGVKILLELYKKEEYRQAISHLLNEQVLIAPDNQLGQYAEKWLEIIKKDDIPELIKVVEIRQPELEKPSHQKRIERVLLKLHKKLK